MAPHSGVNGESKGEGQDHALAKDGASLYDVLGVDKSATQEEIKKAYRKVRLVNLSCDCNVGKWFKWKLKSIHDFFLFLQTFSPYCLNISVSLLFCEMHFLEIVL